jgi:hypothetical protein
MKINYILRSFIKYQYEPASVHGTAHCSADLCHDAPVTTLVEAAALQAH